MSYTRRYNAATGMVSYDLLPSASPLRPFLTGFGIWGAFGASLLLADSGGWGEVASLALRGGAFVWLASVGWEAYDAYTIWQEMRDRARAPKPTPAQAVLIPASPDSAGLHPANAARDMRHEVMGMLALAIARNGEDSNVIPRHDKLGWSSDRRSKAIDSIATQVDVSPRGTTVRGRTLAELVKAVSNGTVKPMAVSA